MLCATKEIQIDFSILPGTCWTRFFVFRRKTALIVLMIQAKMEIISPVPSTNAVVRFGKSILYILLYGSLLNY